MRNVVIVLLLGIGTWIAYQRHAATTVVEWPAQDDPAPRRAPAATRLLPSAPPAPESGAFACDGRTHCSQMRSCAEARYFLAHCPGVEMDGDGDGVPCERQWCG